MFRQYYSSDAPESLLEKSNVLSVVSFNTECTPPHSAGLIPIGLESLSAYSCEVIECSGEVTRGTEGDCFWSHSDDIICAAIWITPEDCHQIQTATKNSYLSLLNCIRSKGFPHPFRFWNFIPHINQGPGDLEEYKKFCAGRLEAFVELDIIDEAFPAASALGHHAKGAVIYVLASRNPGVHHENPRQQKAYQYPRQYGPSSPSFSRATSIALDHQHWAFISGTASILGHETHSPGDTQEQLSVTVENIELLAKHIHERYHTLDTIRVYLRNTSDYSIAQSYLSEYFPEAKILYTCADVCRSNLLVEIEANFSICRP